MDSPHRGGRESIRLFLGPSGVGTSRVSGERSGPPLNQYVSHLKRCPNLAADGPYMRRYERDKLERWSSAFREAWLMRYLARETVVPV
jgi:hypothetical protein